MKKENSVKFLTKNDNRLSNFELLRIFAMFLIVLHHCTVHGIFSYWSANVSVSDFINNIVCFFLSSGGKIGVMLFLLLTGYFSCQQNFKLRKWLDVYLKMLFFSVLIFALWFFISPDEAKAALKYSVRPLTRNAYWFTSSWLALYALSPLLNRMLHKFSQRTVRYILIFGLIFLFVLPTFGMNIAKYSKLFRFYYLVHFIYLYLLGASIRLEQVKFSKKYLLLLSLSIFCFVFAMLSSEFFLWGKEINLWDFFAYTELYTLYSLSASLWLFYLFKDLKIKSSFVNWTASSMFSVYLLHDNTLIRPFLWHTLLAMDRAMSSSFFIVWIFIVSASVFALCIVIDKLLSLIYRPLLDFLENALSKIKPLRRWF